MIFFSVIETTKSHVRDAYIRKIFKANVGKKGGIQFAVFSLESLVYSLLSSDFSLRDAFGTTSHSNQGS
jgi:hypothetical protein